MKYVIAVCLLGSALGWGHRQGAGGFGQQGLGGFRSQVPYANPFPFLNDVNDQNCVQSYFQIQFNPDMTLANIEANLTTWAQQCGVATQYGEFVANMTKFEAELRTNVSRIVSNLPQTLQQLDQIFNDTDQTWTDIGTKYEAFIQNLLTTEPQMIRVIFALLPMGERGGHGHGMKGGFPGQGGRGGRGGQNGFRGFQGGNQGGFSNNQQGGFFGGNQDGFQVGPGGFGNQGQGQQQQGGFGSQGQGQQQQGGFDNNLRPFQNGGGNGFFRV